MSDSEDKLVLSAWEDENVEEKTFLDHVSGAVSSMFSCGGRIIK
jgi:hypothetical protein